MKRWICCAGLVLCVQLVAAPEPVLDLSANVAIWLASCPEAVATNTACEALTTLGISNVTVSAAADEGGIFAAVKIGTTLTDARSTWLSHTNLIQLEPVSENEFRFVPGNPDDIALQLIGDHLRVRFSGSTVVVAAEDRLSSAEALAFNADEKCLLEGVMRVAPLLTPLLEAFDKIVAAEEEGLGKAIMAAMLKSLKSNMDSIRDYPSVSFSIMAPNPEKRSMTLSLNFQTADAASGIKTFFDNAADAWKNPQVSRKQLSLTGLVDTPFFQEMELEESEVQFRYAWPSSDDPDLLTLVIHSLAGSLFSFTDGKSFPVKPEETMAAPTLESIAALDADRFEKEFRASLFLEHIWKSYITLVVDVLDIPNAELLSVDITEVSMLATNGAEVARQNQPGSFNYRRASRSASISLHAEKDCVPPKTASFSLNFSMPTEIEKFRLSKTDPVMESGDRGCVLIAASNSVVSLRSKGISLRDAKVYALNADGEYLTSSGASWSESYFRGEYNGAPAAVELVFPVKTESVSLRVNDIAVGEKDRLEMPSEPTDSIISRYSLEPVKAWSNPDMDAIAAGSMTYVTNAGWKKNEVQLQFPKPHGVKIERLAVKSYLAGVTELVSRGEGSATSSSGDHFYWDLKQTNAVSEATAIFGELEGSFRSGIETCSAEVSTNPIPLIPGRDLPKAWAEDNIAWIEYEKEGAILDIQAFDKSGRRLKKSTRTSSRMSIRGYFFWGLPSRVTVVYSSSNESIVVPFEIELKQGGLEAIPATRAKIAAFEEQLEFVEKIGKKARGRYGNLLSAFYYAHNSNNEPSAYIPLEVAHSDPIGAAVFGYEPKPCNGYFLRKISLKKGPDKEIKKTSYAWAGGAFEATYDDALLLALPADKKDPAILLRWSDVYVNYNDCSKMEHVPSQTSELAAAGWIEVE